MAAPRSVPQTPPVIPHTRVPNLVVDFILPCLNGAEAACLMYVMRRTYGFASADGTRKVRDRISLTQFEHGIQSGDYVLDIGTGLTKQTIIRALRALDEKNLLLIARHCSRCLWEQNGDGPTPAGERCPRCRRTLDKWFSMVDLSPRSLVAFMNANDPRRRVWSWDVSVKRLRVAAVADVDAVDGGDARQKCPAGDVQALSDYVEMFWYPKLVEAVISELVHAKGGARLTDAQIKNHVYLPVIALQERAARNPGVVKHALSETIKRGVVRQVKEQVGAAGRTTRRVNFTWHRYAKAIVDRALATQPVGPSIAAAASKDPAQVATERERGARDLLERAAQLNMDNQAEAARAVLSELLGMAEDLAPLVGGSAERADAHLRCAFKKGLSDMLGAPRAASVADHYPEWTWPAGLSVDL